jgi:DNA end-binding protein Ku
MQRAMWKGRIQSGPIDLPVKLYSAISDITVHSHFLHDQDQVRLEQRMLCSADGRPVPSEEIGKAFEVKKDKYIVIDDEELDFAEPEASRQIEVSEFVDADSLDAKFLDRSYYVGPDGDDQLYVDFVSSLKCTKQAGMCRWVMRKRSYVGVLMPANDILVLTTHRYADEVVPSSSLKLEKSKMTSKETTIAKNLVLELEEKFEPEKYKDEYQAKLQKLIEKKAKGQKVELPELEKPEATEDKELMGALERSLKAVKRK